jgi:hypothetical protein
MMDIAPIERDEQMDRTYIPVAQGWEVQTKGKGSSFRIAETKPDSPRYLVTDKFLHEPLEQMARAIHAERLQAQAEKAELVRQCAEIVKLHDECNELGTFTKWHKRFGRLSLHHAILSLLPKE